MSVFEFFCMSIFPHTPHRRRPHPKQNYLNLNPNHRQHCLPKYPTTGKSECIIQWENHVQIQWSTRLFRKTLKNISTTSLYNGTKSAQQFPCSFESDLRDIFSSPFHTLSYLHQTGKWLKMRWSFATAKFFLPWGSRLGLKSLMFLAQIAGLGHLFHPT